MLYPRWLETLKRHKSRPAILDGNTVITFGDLAAELANRPVATGLAAARTGGPEFFISVLRAWRDGQPVIPLERDAPLPLLKRDPPPGTELVKHTAGATGIPRGIFFSGAQIAADADRIVGAMGLSPAVPNLAVVSLAHSYGFSNVALPLLLHGVPVRLVPVPFPRVIEEAFAAQPELVVAAVPSMWKAWQRAGILKNAPIRMAVSAGAPLSLALETDIFLNAGLKIRNFYGASECGGVSFDLTDVPRTGGDEVGAVLPGVSVDFDDDGRVTISGDAVASGYDEPRDGDALGDGRYLSRDLGRMDAEGKVHLTGSVGGSINVAGRKVSPAKVEAALMATGLVVKAAVRGIASADLERCQEIAATVSVAAEVTAEALKAAVAGRLETWELPRHWEISASGAGAA